MTRLTEYLTCGELKTHQVTALERQYFKTPSTNSLWISAFNPILLLTVRPPEIEAKSAVSHLPPHSLPPFSRPSGATHAVQLPHSFPACTLPSGPSLVVLHHRSSLIAWSHRSNRHDISQRGRGHSWNLTLRYSSVLVLRSSCPLPTTLSRVPSLAFGFAAEKRRE